MGCVLCFWLKKNWFMRVICLWSLGALRARARATIVHSLGKYLFFFVAIILSYAVIAAAKK